jgi:hypothetical protein
LLFTGLSVQLIGQPRGSACARAKTMRTANYVFSVISIILGIALILFVLMQSVTWNIGIAIGLVLILNGSVRLWFAQDDQQ